MAASEAILVGLAAILILGVSSQWIAWRLRLPSILVLLVVGFLAGGVTGFLQPDELVGDLLPPFVALAVGIILFEGGLTLNLKEIRGHGPIVTRLVTLGALVTWVLTSLAAAYIVGLDWPLAILLAAILVITGPTVIGPLLRYVRPKGRVGTVVKWEGILNDPIGALLAVLVFEAVSAADVQQASSRVILSLLEAFGFGALVGVGAAMALYALIRRRWVPDHLEVPVTLALVLAAFVTADLLQPESGLLATTIMGIILANQSKVKVHHIIEFKETLTLLLIATLFILLSARLQFADLQQLGWGAVAFLAILMFVIRPIAVFASTWGSNFSWQERLFLTWMAPRGIVAAAVTSVFALELQEQGHEQAAVLVPLMFLVIVATVAIYGLTARPLARALGVAGPAPEGVLFMGANPLSRALARPLQQAGISVLLVDTNPMRVLDATREGLPAFRANAVGDDFRDALDPGKFGKLLAMTPNDEANTVAALAYDDVFGRSDVYQLAPHVIAHRESPGHVESRLYGRILFARDLTYHHLIDRLEAGDRVLTVDHDEFDEARLAGPSGEKPIPLFVISETGSVSFYTAGRGGPTTRLSGTLHYLGGSPGTATAAAAAPEESGAE